MAKQMMKNVTKTAKEMLTNKYVLYTLLLLAILNVLAFLMTNNFVSLAVFALIGLLTSYFTKNMVVILLVAIVVSGFIHISKATVEGMTKMGNGKMKDEDKTNSGSEKDADDADDAVDSDEDEDDENKEIKPKKVKGHLQTDAPMAKKPKHQLNHQATVADSYKKIHSLLGSKNFSQMTKDTHDLLNQQTKLAESLQNMTPLLNKAETMLNKFDMKNLDMGNLKSMMDSLNPDTQKQN